VGGGKAEKPELRLSKDAFPSLFSGVTLPYLEMFVQVSPEPPDKAPPPSGFGKSPGAVFSFPNRVCGRISPKKAFAGIFRRV
jgi:hypothetical protein